MAYLPYQNLTFDIRNTPNTQVRSVLNDPFICFPMKKLTIANIHDVSVCHSCLEFSSCTFFPYSKSLPGFNWVLNMRKMYFVSFLVGQRILTSSNDS